MPRPWPGLLHTITGTALVNAYSGATPSTTASAAFNVGGARRVRFYVRIALAVGSSLTSITIKLQHRYNDEANSITLGWNALASRADDAAATGFGTLALEQAFTGLSANASYDRSFFLDLPDATGDMRLDVKANTTGSVGDTVTIYGVAA